ncbi:MAG: hypothetical protein NUV53_01810 [Patescibacteria group bacterium]|nr:hypothetical protein [Patescibacteria group bacterium]
MKKSGKTKRKLSIPLILILLILALVGIVFAILARHVPRDSKAPLTDSETERHVLNKAFATPLSTNLIPVIIYEVLDGKTNYGCIGTCYPMTNGVYNMVTMSHAFFPRPRNPAFILRKLTPCEPMPTWCIYRILTNHWKNSSIDLVECEVGPITGALPSIHCDVEQHQNQKSQLFTLAQGRQVGITSVEGGVTSIISGEHTDFYGIVAENSKSWYFLINLSLMNGESGTCFIDRKGNLYFGEGGSKEPIEERIFQELKLSTYFPGLVLGPMKRKN